MIKRNKKLFLIILLILLIGSVAFLFFYNRNHKLTTDKKSDVAGQLDRQNQQAKNNANKSNNTVDSSGAGGSSKDVVNPVLTRWGIQDSNLEAAGFVQGVYEDGGTCTYKITQGSKTITRTSYGFKDATTTTCSPVQIPVSEIGSGKWTIYIVYDSSAANGTSNKQDLDL